MPTSLTVDRATEDVVGTAVELDPTQVDGIQPNAEVQAIVEGYQAQLGEELGKTVGQATTSILRGSSRGHRRRPHHP